MNLLVLLVDIAAAVDFALALIDVWGPPAMALVAGVFVRATRRRTPWTSVRTGSRTPVRTSVRARAVRTSHMRSTCTDICPDKSTDSRPDVSGHDNGGS